MKDDEFAFFNQQLAAMLRDGIPLEGALPRDLCQEMRAGSLRTELQALEADLAKGTPMADALAPRQLPELYKRMILVGVKSGDLPGVLTMLADYFQRQNNIWTRLKGLMVYPIIVLIAAFLLAGFLSFILATFLWGNFASLANISHVPVVWAGLWNIRRFFRNGGAGSFGCSPCSFDTPKVALAAANFQRSQPGAGCIRHEVDVEERGAIGRRAVIPGAT